jgi:hypothetical protein
MRIGGAEYAWFTYIRSSVGDGDVMKLFMVYKAASGNAGCPTVYETDRGTLVVQGQQVVDSEALASLEDVVIGEVAVEVPRQLLLGALPRIASR